MVISRAAVIVMRSRSSRRQLDVAFEPSSSLSRGRVPAFTVSVLSSRSYCRYRRHPNFALLRSSSWRRHHRHRRCRHSRRDVTLLTSRVVVAILPPVTAVIPMSVLAPPLRRRPDVISLSSSSRSLSTFRGFDVVVLQLFHDLRYHSAREKWT